MAAVGPVTLVKVGPMAPTPVQNVHFLVSVFGHRAAFADVGDSEPDPT